MENVTSNSPAVTLIVEHSSLYSSTLRSGQVTETALRLCYATALSGSIPPNFEGSASENSPVDLSFRGRGVSTTWHIYIEKDEIGTKQIDPSQSSKIEISIGYRSFLIPS